MGLLRSAPHQSVAQIRIAMDFPVLLRNEVRIWHKCRKLVHLPVPSAHSGNGHCLPPPTPHLAAWEGIVAMLTLPWTVWPDDGDVMLPPTIFWVPCFLCNTTKHPAHQLPQLPNEWEEVTYMPCIDTHQFGVYHCQPKLKQVSSGKSTRRRRKFWEVCKEMKARSLSYC